jgi:hypothetical protein
MVTQWMKDENITRWSLGIQFIAHMKNNRYPEAMKKTSYVLWYGQEEGVMSVMEINAAVAVGRH